MVQAKKVFNVLQDHKIPFIFYLSRDDAIFNEMASNWGFISSAAL